MATAYLSLGSNLGDRRQLIEKALRALDRHDTCVVGCSTFIETQPWGFDSPHPFLNAAACITTSLSAHELLDVTRKIEISLGRTLKTQQGEGYHDRLIDIDLLLYTDENGCAIIDEPCLKLPHPLLHLRTFVLEPLCQLCPDLQHPLLHRSMSQLLRDLTKRA